MVSFGILWFGLKETRGNVLLGRKAMALNAWLDEQEQMYGKQIGRRLRWKVKVDEVTQSVSNMIKMSLTRAFRGFPFLCFPDRVY